MHVPMPAVAPTTAPPALNTGAPYGSPFVPLSTPAPASETSRIEHAAALTDEAEAWVAHATAAGMDPATALRKALSAVGFSVRHRARALAIPSKLRGVKAHQDAVARLAELADAHHRRGLGLPLLAEVAGDEDAATITVAFENPETGEPVALGTVQPKHVRWLRPLLAVGATVALKAVTGREPNKTMGVNVLFAYVGRAIHARRFAAGPAPQPSEDDVVLRRTRSGDAEVRLGRDVAPLRDGYEWGYLGAGPARLALAVLRRFVQEDDARRLAPAFKTEVIAAVPRAGVVIEAAFVWAWIAQQSAN